MESCVDGNAQLGAHTSLEADIKATHGENDGPCRNSAAWFTLQKPMWNCIFLPTYYSPTFSAVYLAPLDNLQAWMAGTHDACAGLKKEPFYW